MDLLSPTGNFQIKNSYAESHCKNIGKCSNLIKS